MDVSGVTPDAVQAEMTRVTGLARQYADMAQRRAKAIEDSGNIMTVEQAAAMATMYSTSVIMLQNAVTMAGSSLRRM